MSVVCFKDKIATLQGYDIELVCTKPLDMEEHSCVILLHGTCSDMNEVGNAYVYLANRLANAGYAAIRFDFIGCGKSKVDYLYYSYQSAVQDTKAVIAYARQAGYNNIILLGWSQGATIAMLSAEEQCKGVVALANAANMRDFICQHDLKQAQKEGYVWYDPIFRDPVKLSLAWFEDVLTTDVLAIFAQKRLPTLAIHGMMDEVVDPIMSKQIVQASHHPLSKVVYMDACNHIFNVLTHEYRYFKVVCDEIIDWMQNVQ